MTEQVQLPEVMAKCTELHVWYMALQEAGFSEAMAYGLLQTLLLTGTVNRD